MIFTLIKNSFLAYLDANDLVKTILNILIELFQFISNESNIIKLIIF